MNNKVFTFLAVASLLSLFLVVRMGKTESKVSTTLPCAKIGKCLRISGLVKVDRDTSPNSFKMTGASERIFAVFIFKPSCYYCDPNLFLWKKIKRSFKDRINVCGIILSDPSDAANFSKLKDLNFSLYMTPEIEKFKTDFNVKFDLSQTVLLDKSRVVYSKSGRLKADDFFAIKKIITERESK